MMNQTHEHERAALDQGLLDGGSLATRMLSAAAESGMRRDAARANVVLAFEPDVTHHLRAAIPSPDADIDLIRRRERTRGLVERMVELGGGLDAHEDPRAPGFWHNVHSVFHRGRTL